MPDDLAKTVQDTVIAGGGGDAAMLELDSCFYYVEGVPFYILSFNIFEVARYGVLTSPRSQISPQQHQQRIGIGMAVASYFCYQVF
jgi:hypothetical protein